jgi:hypothetical protein
MAPDKVSFLMCGSLVRPYLEENDGYLSHFITLAYLREGLTIVFEKYTVFHLVNCHVFHTHAV